LICPSIYFAIIFHLDVVLHKHGIAFAILSHFRILYKLIGRYPHSFHLCGPTFDPDQEKQGWLDASLRRGKQIIVICLQTESTLLGVYTLEHTCVFLIV
jgi:hypothetical protein